MTYAEFIDDLEPWGSHRKLLWYALESTKHLKLPVLELGSGESSTPFLVRYCQDENLQFESYDSNKDWAKKTGSTYIANWDNAIFWNKRFSVCLLDLSPGEYRKIALMKLPNTEVICIHDSEAPGWNASDYKVRPLFKHFKYVNDDVPFTHGAPWTTLLSNTVDITLIDRYESGFNN